MRRIAELGELALIRRIESLAGRTSASHRAVALGIGDDAAVLRVRSGEEVVATSDALVEDVHFRWSTQAPTPIGRRALAATLSDLAAMGARPLGCLFSLAAPPSLELRRFDGLARGVVEEAARAGCPLVGGNVARARQVSLTLTALGAVPAGRALRRDAARAGDRIFVTGTLGGAALALARAERAGTRIRGVPEPRLAAGRALVRMGRTHRIACIDVSDGLVSDLGHLLAGPGLGAGIDAARLPRPPGFDAACARLGLDPATLLASGGEDYELLFTLDSPAASKGPSERVLARRLGVPVTEIGRVTRRRGLRGLPASALRRPGWRHF
ncbi:MAG: thiamine-phosphate kinase [Proteobacteria bacterium]|nr:thiamine-phosphate kinase [Pseudomonadota bacterium]